jgi:hypothetical protein
MTKPTRSAQLDELRRELAGRRMIAVGPPLPEDEIAAIEARLGMPLPAGYRSVLAELGPFEDDTGFCLQVPRRIPEAVGAFDVGRDRVLAFARDRIAAAEALERDGTRLLTPTDRFDSVIEKRVLSYGMLDAFADLQSDGPGLLPIAALDGVSGDLYLVVAGELRGTVWFDGDCGFHPELYVSDGQIELHDTLSWALSFRRI